MRMSQWTYALPLRMRSLLQRTRVEQELDEELEDHLAHKTEEFVARGMSPRDARRAAVRSMAGLTQRKEECRDARGVNAIDTTIGDLRYALRLLRKSPGFTAVAIFTLALAIGANAVVFGVMNGLLLRPLNVPEPERLYGIQHANERSMYESYPDYRDLRDRNRSFESMAGFTIDQLGLESGDGATRAWADVVTGNFFDVMLVHPFLGRFFHQTDERGPNTAPYVVLGYDYWHNHFAGDPGIIGREVRLNKHPYTVIGVAPSEFNGPLLIGHPDLYVPVIDQQDIEGKYTLEHRATEALFMTLGRLKPGVTPVEAAADLNSIGAWIEKTYPKDHGAVRFVLARPGLYGDFLAAPLRAFLSALMLLAGLILIAACANLGVLFGARAADRSREIALRMALGATRRRIVRQVLSEALLLSFAGGAVGLWASSILLHAISHWNPFPRFPIFSVPMAPDAKVYALALALALISGLLFSIVPVRQALRRDPWLDVKGAASLPMRGIHLRDMLLAAQIAICAVLVTSSMVAVRGMARSLDSNFGFNPRNAMLVDTDLSMAGYSAGAQTTEMQRRMLETLEAVPGVEAAGWENRVPLNGGGFSALIFPADAADLRPAAALFDSWKFSISPGFLRAAGVKLLSGRDFSWHDDGSAPRVALVNREMARRLFPSGSPAVGRFFKLRDGTRVEIAGVVEDGKYLNLTEPPNPALFFPMLQEPSNETWLVVRSHRDPRQLGPALRAALQQLDRGLPVYIISWEQHLEFPLFPARIATVTLGVLGAIGAILAITGIFGMAAYSVSKRLKELGIRIAIGAGGWEVLQAALGRALKLLAFGSAAGLGLGILAGNLLSHIVYQATPRDPMVLTGVVLAMVALGLIATWMPARRALSVDAAALLREE